MIAAFGPFLPRVSTLGRSPDSMLLHMPLLRMSRSRFSITFDFIEDAALAIPPACRRKLPRCLRVLTRAPSLICSRSPRRACLAGQMATRPEEAEKWTVSCDGLRVCHARA